MSEAFVNYFWWRIGVVSLIVTLPIFYWHIKMVLWEGGIWKDAEGAERIDRLVQASLLAKKAEGLSEHLALILDSIASILWLIFFAFFAIKYTTIALFLFFGIYYLIYRFFEFVF